MRVVELYRKKHKLQNGLTKTYLKYKFNPYLTVR